MSDPATPERITRKEAARLARRAAYRKAKERQATDPKFLAFKAAQKARQKAFQQVQKERRKQAKETRKEQDAAEREEQRVQEARAMFRLISR